MDSGSSTISEVVTGTYRVGSSDTNVKRVFVPFGSIFNPPPSITSSWVVGESKYPDKFTVEVTSVNVAGFFADVERLDIVSAGGWDQTGAQLHYTMMTFPRGEIRIGPSDTSEKQVFVPFTGNRLQRPSSIAAVWVEGENEYPDTFLATVKDVNINEGFTAVVKRTDINHSPGWGQSGAVLHWVSINDQISSVGSD